MEPGPFPALPMHLVARRKGPTLPKKNIPVLSISLKEAVSIDDPYSFSRDYFILVDDAQNLLNCKEVVAFIRKKGKAICLGFSPVLVERHGTLTANYPIQPTMIYYFTPFTEKEIEKCSGVNEECVKRNILLPKFISIQAPIDAIETMICHHLHSMFCKFRNASAELPDDREALTVNLINAACVPGKLSPGEQTAALRSGLFWIPG